jgi:putative ABC transport system substrate-binding protein
MQGSLALTGLGLLSGCGLLPGQRSTPKVVRIGYLGSASLSSDPYLGAFRDGLREIGYVEGENTQIDALFAEGNLDRLPELAAELVGHHPDVILTGGTVQTLAAKQATSTIPIVFANPSDPVGTGLVASLAHPGGNLTGLSTNNRGTVTKRLELLKEVVPTLSKAGVLFNPTDPSNQQDGSLLEEGARALGITLVKLGVGPKDSFEAALQTASEEAIDGVMCQANPFFGSRRAEIVSLLATSRLPALYAQREFVLEGGLMSYAANFADNYRRAATYVDKILKGAKPADLPVEQPTKFDFVVNLKTAQALGLTIPLPVLQQATELIQ